MGGNHTDQTGLAARIEGETLKEEALKKLGWFQVDGVWFNPFGVSFDFEGACRFMGFPE